MAEFDEEFQQKLTDKLAERLDNASAAGEIVGRIATEARQQGDRLAVEVEKFEHIGKAGGDMAFAAQVMQQQAISEAIREIEQALSLEIDDSMELHAAAVATVQKIPPRNRPGGGRGR